MNKLIIPFTLMIVFASVGCGTNNSNSTIESESGTTVEVKDELETPASSSIQGESENFTIRHGAVGPFSLDAAIPEDSSFGGYNLVRKMWRPGVEDIPSNLGEIDCMKNGERHIVLYPNLIADGNAGSVISKILVYSERYKTDAGIGTGNTIEEFYSHYADAKAYHSFLNNLFWLETGEMPGVHFIMDQEDAEEPDYDSAITEVDKRNFKKGSRITYVRISK